MPDIEYTTDEQVELMREELRLAKKKPGGEKSEKTPESKRIHTKKMIKKTFGLLSFGITVVFLSAVLISVLMAKSRGETPNLLGFQLYVVQSGSMAPTLKVGTVILSRIPEDNKTLNADDIVTFKTKSGVVITHRVIEVVQDDNGRIKYRTKGDNPVNSPDTELLDSERVLARFIAKIPLT